MSFSRLGIREGLQSSITIQGCFDNNGFIWVCTANGLNFFDGVSVTQYSRETHPGLPINEIGFLSCDSKNRIWISTNKGLAVLDEKRKLHTVVIHDTLKATNIDFAFEIPRLGIVAIDHKRAYLQQTGSGEWKIFLWLNKYISTGVIRSQRFDDTKQIILVKNRLLLLDLLHQKLLADLFLPGVEAACKLTEGEILASSGPGFNLYRVNLSHHSISRLPAVTTSAGRSLIKHMELAGNGAVYMTTERMGLFSFDPGKDSLVHYKHDPIDEQSLASDASHRVYTHPRGNILITSSNGASYANVNYVRYNAQTYFKDQYGNIMDGQVSGINMDHQKNLWLSTASGIHKWNGKDERAEKIHIPGQAAETSGGLYLPGVPAVDKDGKIWIPVREKGIAIFNAGGKLLRWLDKKHGLPTLNIRVLANVKPNTIMAGTDDGLFFINSQTFSVDSISKNPALKSIRKKRIVSIYVDGTSVWMAASPAGGAYKYDFSNDSLTSYTIKNGLLSERTYCITSDAAGNIYVGGRRGLNVIQRDGSIQNITRENGLLSDRIDNLITDDSGYVWISNENVLIRYNPLKKQLKYFDEHNGITNSFGVAVSYKSPDGSLLFGSSKGLVTVDPKQVFEQEVPLSLSVFRMHDDNSLENINQQKLAIPYNNAKLALYYTASDLMSAKRLFFRYRLDGLDTGWSAPTKSRTITYNLRPGRYAFRLESSYNGRDWTGSLGMLPITVSTPYWQQWWFYISLILLASLFTFFIAKQRIRSIRRRGAIQQQLSELEGKALRAQMNPHFIFNSLNAIQECFLLENYDAGYEYLSKFSRLLRMVLNNSEKNLIPLADEIEMIRLYLELELLRFKKTFSYTIEIDDQMEVDTTMVPSLLLQPYIENALWHGLIHKDGIKKLSVRFSENACGLEYIIEDNGIGREKAREIKAKKIGAEHFESKGMKLSEQRIRLLNEHEAGRYGVTVQDLYSGDQNPAGTRVVISLPNKTVTC